MNAFEALKDLLFIDIETATPTMQFTELPLRWQQQWAKRAPQFSRDTPPDELYAQKASILAEFGQVITIGVGYFYQHETELRFRVKAFSGESEANLLQAFKDLLTQKFKNKRLRFVAHNGKDFDYPYLCRRMLINGMALPEALDLTGKRAWEVPHYDTLDMWRFGEYKHFVSLDLLAAAFDLPTSKNDLDGSQVNTAYHAGEAERIAAYCKNDVILTARVFLKMKGLGNLPDEAIEFAP